MYKIEMYWTTRDEEDILYKDLKDSHIKNIINLYTRKAKERNTVPEAGSIAFHYIMDEVERRNLDVGYTRYRPSELDKLLKNYAQFQTFSIYIGKKEPHCVAERIPHLEKIFVLKERIDGDISQFEEIDNLICLPMYYEQVISDCEKRWKYECESWEESFHNHGCGYAWGNG